MDSDNDFMNAHKCFSEEGTQTRHCRMTEFMSVGSKSLELEVHLVSKRDEDRLSELYATSCDGCAAPTNLNEDMYEEHPILVDISPKGSLCSLKNGSLTRHMKSEGLCFIDLFAEHKLPPYLNLVSARGNISFRLPSNAISKTPISVSDPVKLNNGITVLLQNLDSYRTDKGLATKSKDSPDPAAIYKSYDPKNSMTTQGTINRKNTGLAMLESALSNQDTRKGRNTGYGRQELNELKGSSFSDSGSFTASSYCSSSYDTGAGFSGILTHGSDAHQRKISDSTLLSCPSSKTMFSNLFKPPSGRSICRGVFRCLWRNGIPNVIFSAEGLGKVYTANPFRIESQEKRSFEWVYVFYEKTTSRGDLNVIGKMKVKSSLHLSVDDHKQSEHIESEFVLFGVSEKNEEVGKNGFTGKALRKRKVIHKVSRILKTGLSYDQSFFDGLVRSSNFKTEEFSKAIMDPYKHTFLDSFTGDHLLENLMPNLEMTAIVVKSRFSPKYRAKSVVVGGWGLKFLIKKDAACLDSLNPTVEDTLESPEKSNSNVIDELTVLVPGDFHGGPRNRGCGPSSLIERWKTNGRCDCGGWDLGCPLKVLNNNKSSNGDASILESSETCKFFGLYNQGSTATSPILKMECINEDVYMMDFHSSLSVLQAFSVGVAVIHSRTPALIPKPGSTGGHSGVT